MALELFEKHVGRKPLESEIQVVKQKFFALLENNIKADPALCQPLLGATTLFKRIVALGDWDIGIATGCWRDSAILKLKYVNVPYLQ